MRGNIPLIAERIVRLNDLKILKRGYRREQPQNALRKLELEIERPPEDSVGQRAARRKVWGLPFPPEGV